VARPAIDQTRRRELIQATFTAIHRTGLAEPTLAIISQHANIGSASIVNHYFDNKQDLLEHAMRELARDFLGEVALRVGAAKTPTERVLAIIDANFAPSQCTEEVVSAWLWFWSRTPSNPVFAEVERATHRKVIGELKAGLKELVPVQQVKDAAESLMALMYGLWLRFALDPSSLDVEAARRITRETFLMRLKGG
jgi:TetR/AcrR family transcriptional regulator, transcriptional repressor of bet genes